MSPCPARDHLERFLTGGLSESEEEAVCTHVEGCAACQDVLEALVKAHHGPRLSLLDPGARSRGPHFRFLDKLKRAPPGP